MQKEIFKYLPHILAMLFVAGFTVFAWTEPTSAPPAGNVVVPLNVGPTGQSKEGGLILNTGGAANGLIVDGGESLFPSITVVGGAALPGCDSSKRGKMFLLQSGAGIADGFYICKKKSNDSYDWEALGSPEIVTLWENKNLTAVAINNQPTQTISDTKSIPNDAEILTCAVERKAEGAISGFQLAGFYGTVTISGPEGFWLQIAEFEANALSQYVYLKSKTANLSTGGNITATCSSPLFSTYNSNDWAFTSCNFSCYYVKKK